MRKRSKAREYALQMLYQVDLKKSSPVELIAEFWEANASPEDVRQFAEVLVRGTTEHIKEIDSLITAHASNWTLKRMGVVDRNVLRLGAFELLHLEDVPPKVSINEAVELAKRFGDKESGKFINGILDAIHKSTGDAGDNHKDPPIHE